MNYIGFNDVKKVNGIEFRLEVKLHDECHNGHCDFRVHMDKYKKKRDGSYELVGFTNGDVEIDKMFPYVKKWSNLHLCNYLGQPMYRLPT